MKKVILLLLIVLFAKNTSSQNMGMHNYDMGSARKLNGSICIVTVFIENGYTITQEEKDNYFKKLAEAERYLINQAKPYGKYLTFYNKSVNNNACFKYTCDKEMVKACPEDVIKMIKGFDYDTYSSNLKRSYDNVVIIMCMKFEPSRRNFCWMNKPGCRMDKLEGVTMNFNYMYKYAMSGIIAHEVLHCFGARDFYDLAKYKNGYYARYDGKMSNTLMGSINNADVNKFSIDDATAYIVGLTNNYLTWFDELYEDGIN